MRNKDIRVSIDRRNVDVSSPRELMLASTYAAVVRNLKIRSPIKDVVLSMNNAFKTDFTFDEVFKFLEKNKFHEDFEYESRRQELINYGRYY